MYVVIVRLAFRFISLFFFFKKKSFNTEYLYFVIFLCIRYSTAGEYHMKRIRGKNNQRHSILSHQKQSGCKNIIKIAPKTKNTSKINIPILLYAISFVGNLFHLCSGSLGFFLAKKCCQILLWTGKFTKQTTR